VRCRDRRCDRALFAAMVGVMAIVVATAMIESFMLPFSA
jgi:hypothetical protein